MKLAEKIEGLSAKDISKAERGEKTLTDDQLEAVAAAIGVTRESLLETAEEPAADEKKEETPAAPETEFMESFLAADDDTKKAAMAVLKSEAPAQKAGDETSPLGTVLNVLGGMLSSAQGGEGGENPLAAILGGGNSSNPLATIVNVLGSMMAGKQKAAPEAEDKAAEQE